MNYDMLKAVLIFRLEVLMNRIGLNEEDTQGSYVGSFDGMTYGKKNLVSFLDNILKKSMDAEMVESPM